jgi:predicted O-methyltransferase YrrM
MSAVAQQLPGYGPETPVSIFQWEAEFQVALELYRRLRPESVLEVGTYHGGTLYHWLRNAAPGTKVVTLDSYGVGVDNRHLYHGWIPEGVELTVLEGDSNSVYTQEEVAEHAPFDWAFIDAGHYYHEVKEDWLAYAPMVEDGGVMLFHDILPPSQEHPEIEVAQLWEELKRTHHCLEIVANRDASWGGIGVVLL